MATEIPTDGRTITRVRQYRTCGKTTCGCHKDKGRRHGPYLYAYWRENGKLISKYLGKVLTTQNGSTDSATIEQVQQ